MLYVYNIDLYIYILYIYIYISLNRNEVFNPLTDEQHFIAPQTRTGLLF